MPLDPKQQPPYYTPGTTPAQNPIEGQYTAWVTQGTISPPSATILINTLGFGNWTRPSLGLYKCISTTTWNENKTYLPGTAGTNFPSMIPITNGSALLGYILLYIDGNGGVLNYYIECLDSTFAAVDLNALTTKLQLPTITLYK